MRRYSTSNITVGIVDPRDFVSTNAMAIVRTIFGDKNIEINNKTKLVITESGEVVSITNDNYLSNYSKTRKKFVLNTDYYPTIKIADTGKTFSLMDFVKPYISTGRMNIRAKKLNKTTKLFTVWDNEKYMLGYKGDYLAVSEDDENYVFIISKDQFSKTYSRVIK